MNRDTGNTAFPVTDENGANYPHFGMTLRDYFAAKAMQGMLACAHPYAQSDEKMFARDAYVLADAMLAERDK